MSMDLFIARTVITKASLVFHGSIYITGTQVTSFFTLLIVLTLKKKLLPAASN